MLKSHSLYSAASMLVALAILGASVRAHAETEPAKSAAPAAPEARRQCEGARLARWFDGQRQLTDGSADPFRYAVGRDACVQ